MTMMTMMRTSQQGVRAKISKGLQVVGMASDLEKGDLAPDDQWNESSGCIAWSGPEPRDYAEPCSGFS